MQQINDKNETNQNQNDDSKKNQKLRTNLVQEQKKLELKENKAKHKLKKIKFDNKSKGKKFYSSNLYKNAFNTYWDAHKMTKKKIKEIRNTFKLEKDMKQINFDIFKLGMDIEKIDVNLNQKKDKNMQKIYKKQKNKKKSQIKKLETYKLNIANMYKLLAKKIRDKIKKRYEQYFSRYEQKKHNIKMYEMQAKNKNAHISDNIDYLVQKRTKQNLKKSRDTAKEDYEISKDKSYSWMITNSKDINSQAVNKGLFEYLSKRHKCNTVNTSNLFKKIKEKKLKAKYTYSLESAKCKEFGEKLCWSMVMFARQHMAHKSVLVASSAVTRSEG